MLEVKGIQLARWYNLLCLQQLLRPALHNRLGRGGIFGGQHLLAHPPAVENALAYDRSNRVVGHAGLVAVPYSGSILEAHLTDEVI